MQEIRQYHARSSKLLEVEMRRASSVSLSIQLTSLPIILIVGGTAVDCAAGAIAPALADIDDDAVIVGAGPPNAEAPAMDEDAEKTSGPTEPAACCGSDSSRTDSLSKLIFTCDQRAIEWRLSFLRRASAWPRLLCAAVLSSLPSSNSFVIELLYSPSVHSNSLYGCPGRDIASVACHGAPGILSNSQATWRINQ